MVKMDIERIRSSGSNKNLVRLKKAGIKLRSQGRYLKLSQTEAKISLGTINRRQHRRNVYFYLTGRNKKGKK